MRAVAEQGALRGFGWTVSVVHVAVSGTGLQCSGNPMAGRGASVTMELLPTGGSTMAMSTGDDPDRTELLATRGPVAGDAGGEALAPGARLGRYRVESLLGRGGLRSEVRRVGKEGVRTCRPRWSPHYYKKNNDPTHLC